MDQKDLVMQSLSINKRINDEKREQKAEALRAELAALEPAKPKRRTRKAPVDTVEVAQDAE